MTKKYRLYAACKIFFYYSTVKRPGGYCQFLVPDSYQAAASLYITGTQSNDQANVSYTNLQTSAALTKDYESIIKNRYVLMQVIDNLGLSVDYGELYDMIPSLTV